MSRGRSDEDTVKLKVQYNKDGVQTFFRVKRSIKLQKLMEAFCKKRSLDPKSMQFTFDGVGLEKNKTPEELKVQYNKDGVQTFFRVKRSIKLQKLMEAFCKKRSLDPKSMQFTFDGVGLEKNKTPEELGMEDGDEIDALEHFEREPLDNSSKKILPVQPISLGGTGQEMGDSILRLFQHCAVFSVLMSSCCLL
ncbi:unnamed protein product [Prunus armeniaca]